MIFSLLDGFKSDSYTNGRLFVKNDDLSSCPFKGPPAQMIDVFDGIIPIVHYGCRVINGSSSFSRTGESNVMTRQLGPET